MLALGAALALVLAVGLPGGVAPTRASAQSGVAEPTPQTDASIPARKVTLIGATPQEAGAPGAEEVWGVGVPPGNEGAGALLVRYSRGGGWSLGPALLDASGQALSDFRLDASPLAGQMTARWVYSSVPASFE